MASLREHFYYSFDKILTINTISSTDDSLTAHVSVSATLRLSLLTLSQSPSLTVTHRSDRLPPVHHTIQRSDRLPTSTSSLSHTVSPPHSPSVTQHQGPIFLTPHPETTRILKFSCRFEDPRKTTPEGIVFRDNSLLPLSQSLRHFFSLFLILPFQLLKKKLSHFSYLLTCPPKL